MAAVRLSERPPDLAGKEYRRDLAHQWFRLEHKGRPYALVGVAFDAARKAMILFWRLLDTSLGCLRELKARDIPFFERLGAEAGMDHATIGHFDPAGMGRFLKLAEFLDFTPRVALATRNIPREG